MIYFTVNVYRWKFDVLKFFFCFLEGFEFVTVFAFEMSFCYVYFKCPVFWEPESSSLMR